MDKLYAYDTDSLAEAPGSPYSLAASSGLLEGVAATPNGKFVYVVGLAGTVSGFSIGSDFSLTPVPGSPFTVNGQPVAAATESSSKFLFVVNNSNVSIFAIDSATGALTASGTPVALSASSLAESEMAVSPPFSNFLYIAVNGTDQVDAFSFDANTGLLTPINGSPFVVGTGPTGLAATTGTLYVSDSLSGTVSALAWDKNTGSLSEISGSPFAALYGAGLTSLNGQYLYVASVNNVFPPFSNEIFSYSIDPSGALTPLSASPFQVSIPLWGELAAF
jgi:6-phosphogluconolactonase